MLEEKLACPMQDAAHERQFVTAQRGLSALNFHDEHVSIVSRTINFLESKFLHSSAVVQESTCSRPTTPVDPNGCVHYISDLMWQPSDWTDSTPNLESDFEGSVENYALPEPYDAELHILLNHVRKYRQTCYRKKPEYTRVNKNAVRSKSNVHLRSKPNTSPRNLPRSAPGP